MHRRLLIVLFGLGLVVAAATAPGCERRSRQGTTRVKAPPRKAAPARPSPAPQAAKKKPPAHPAHPAHEHPHGAHPHEPHAHHHHPHPHPHLDGADGHHHPY